MQLENIFTKSKKLKKGLRFPIKNGEHGHISIRDITYIAHTELKENRFMVDLEIIDNKHSRIFKEYSPDETIYNITLQEEKKYPVYVDITSNKPYWVELLHKIRKQMIKPNPFYFNKNQNN